MQPISKNFIILLCLLVFLTQSGGVNHPNPIVQSFLRRHGRVIDTQTANSAAQAEPGVTFEEFKKSYKKEYENPVEEVIKRTNFQMNKANLGKPKCHPCGVNSLFDRTPSQLNKLLGLKPHQKNIAQDSSEVNEISEVNLGLTVSGSTARLLITAPVSFDWRSYGVVTPVKDQKTCGSCWSFTAVGFLESESIRRGGAKNIDLSEQYLLKCHTGSLGCNGGDVFSATATGLKGMPFDYRYPYLASTNYNTTMCARPKLDIKFLSSGSVIYYSKTAKANDAAIIQYLLERPLLIGVNGIDMLKYAPTADNKILFCAPENSDGTVINHAVLLVGYNQDAWLIKNSWSDAWGDKGYVWVTRDPTRSCNIGNYWGTVNSPLTPVV